MKNILLNSWLEKTALILLISIPIIALSLAVYGWIIGDFFGGLLISSLPISFVSIVAVVISQFCTEKIYNYSKIFWILSSLFTLSCSILFAVCSIHVDADKGAMYVFFYAIMILGIPSSICIPFIFIATKLLLSPTNHIHYFLFMWIGMFCIAYLQWFIFLPWVLSKMKNKFPLLSG
jgi:hypothetical protein